MRCAPRPKATHVRRHSSGSGSPIAPTVARARSSRNVNPDTPAADVGVEVGDLVVAVDGATIDGSTGLIAAIRDLEPGDSAELTVVRDGEKQTFDVTLTDKPTDPDD